MSQEERKISFGERGGDDRLWTRELAAVLSAGGAFGFSSSVFYLLPKFLTEMKAGAAARDQADLRLEAAAAGRQEEPQRRQVEARLRRVRRLNRRAITAGRVRPVASP